VGEGWESFPSLLVGEGWGGGDTTSWLHCPAPHPSPPSRGEEVWSASSKPLAGAACQRRRVSKILSHGGVNILSDLFNLMNRWVPAWCYTANPSNYDDAKKFSRGC